MANKHLELHIIKNLNAQYKARIKNLLGNCSQLSSMNRVGYMKKRPW